MADNTVRSRRDAQAMEARRLAALPLLEHGESLSAIARRLGVSRQAVFVWNQQWHRRGEAGLRRRLRPGRPHKLARSRLAQLPRLLAQGAEAHGFSSPLWTTFGFATTAITSAAYCTASAGAGRNRRAARGSATKQPSSVGCNTPGRG
jgi:transposase